MSDTSRLLEVVRNTALHHEDLAEALRQSDLSGIERAVARLQTSEPLTREIAGLVERWSRVAVAVQRRLTEEQAWSLLGVDLDALGSVLAAADDAEHVRMFAEWHLRASRRRLGMTAYSAAALNLAVGGTVVLATSRQWMGHGV